MKSSFTGSFFNLDSGTLLRYTDLAIEVSSTRRGGL